MPTAPRNFARTTAAALAIGLLVGGPAIAREDASLIQIDSLVRDLDSPSFETRETAEAELVSDDFLSVIDEDEILEQLKRDDLSPEQRVRLRGAYNEWFVRALNHAGMGVSFASGGDAAPAVVIIETREGFPCHEKELLFPYDALIGIDGVSVHEMRAQSVRRGNAPEDFLRAAIISRRAGEGLRLTLLRPTEEFVRELGPIGANNRANLAQIAQAIAEDEKTQELTIDLPLGSYSDLGNRAAVLNRGLVSRATAMRLARQGVSGAAPAIIRDGAVEEETWRSHSREPNRRSHADILNADAEPSLAAAITNEAVIVAGNNGGKPLRILRNPADRARAMPEQNDLVMLGRRPDTLTPKMKSILEQVEKQNAIVQDLTRKVDKESIVVNDPALSDRERFLARGRLETFRTQLTRAIEIQQGHVSAVRILERRLEQAEAAAKAEQPEK